MDEGDIDVVVSFEYVTCFMLIYYCVPECSLRELDLELIYMREMTSIVVYCVMNVRSGSLIWGGSSVGSS